MILETGFQQRHDERYYLLVTEPTLAVEAYEGAAPAERLLHIDLGIIEVAEVNDCDAPRIDGAVHIATRRPLRAGDIVTVKIERSDPYDLWGTAA